MDEACGTARVKTQYGDDDTKIEVLFLSFMVELKRERQTKSNKMYREITPKQDLYSRSYKLYNLL